MDEDWGATATAKPFSLFKEVDPEEEAMKVGFVDMIVYNHWKKPQRRLYNKVKAEQIKKLLREQELQTIDSLADTLKCLEMFKSADDDPVIQDLISSVSTMHVEKKATKKKKDNAELGSTFRFM